MQICYISRTCKSGRGTQSVILCNKVTKQAFVTQAAHFGFLYNYANLVLLCEIRFYIELNMPGNSERLFIIKLGFSSSLPIVSS
ncbi:hypothetical protein ES703_100568 [subsurface metagenome]